MASPYDVLDIDPEADHAEIDRAYRRRVKEAHPDHGGSLSEFQLVRAAYEELTAGDSVDRFDPTDRSDRWDEYTDPIGRETRVTYLNYEVLDDYGWSRDEERLFQKAATADLDPIDYGQFLVQPNESLLEAAENRGFAWPFACRGGACANCAIIVREGKLSMPVNHILPTGMIEQDVRLSCNAFPLTERMKVIYNVKHLPSLHELKLPPRPFKQALLND